MRSAFVILVLVVIAAVLGIVFLTPGSKPQWSPDTRFTFLGFTNSVAGAPATNAWFGINAIPSEETTWRAIEISHKEGGQWKRWDPLPNVVFQWKHPAPTNYTLGALMPVRFTNAPVRTVFQLSQAPRGKLADLMRRWRMLWARYTHGNPHRAWAGSGLVFLITNEFNLDAGKNSANP